MTKDMILLICVNVVFGWLQMAWGWYRGYVWGKREAEQYNKELEDAIDKLIKECEIVPLVRADA